jgi:diguanylate cyclase (GGDEF)-like protein
MGLRGQLTLLIPGAVAAVMAAGALVELRNQRDASLEDLQAHVHEVLQIAARGFEEELARDDREGVQKVLDRTCAALVHPDLVELAVVAPDGVIMARTGVSSRLTVSDDEFSQNATLAHRTLSVERDGDALQSYPVVVSGLRRATLIARWSLWRVETRISEYRFRLVQVVLAVFFIIGAVLYVGVDRLVIRPIRALQVGVRRIGEGALATRVPELRGAELEELSRRVNAMASALQSDQQTLEATVASRTQELREANERLRQLAVTDGLTGVFNHRRFQEAIHVEILRSQRHSRSMGLLIIDVDHFKRVNDVLGHPAGDALLRRLAEVLGLELRQTDLLARYGGEEFAVILPETPRSEVIQVAERMRSAVELQLNSSDASWPITVTVSVGAAVFPEDGGTAEELIVAADKAMYLAKQQGRNRVNAAGRVRG